MIPVHTFCDKDYNIYTMIETPKGSRNKCDFNPEGNFFELGKILPAGCAFPLDFGFIPETKGEDGDPLDVLVLSDVPGQMGLVIKCRLVGIIEATQKEKGKKKERNDRLLAVALESLDHSNVCDSKDLNENFVKELVHFFEYYNEMCGKKFKLIGVRNKKVALKAVQKGMITRDK